MARDESWLTEVQVCPSILAADFGAFRSQVVELMDAGARTFHVDVMDGHFVPVITFGNEVVEAIADEVHSRGGALVLSLCTLGTVETASADGHVVENQLELRPDQGAGEGFVAVRVAAA